MRVNAAASAASAESAAPARPRLGFAGVGWIGLDRLRRIAAAGDADVVCIADPALEAARRACDCVPLARGLRVVTAFEPLLEADLDGVVIATPSALHAEQAAGALARGLAVFCQKPLARTRQETCDVLCAARCSDRLLAVDFCYRTVAGVGQLAEIVRSGGIGEVYAADLVFHNAYGPDKPWFYDPAQSGGGCVMDLGIHLADLLLWVLDYPEVLDVRSRLHASGKRLRGGSGELEDHAFVELELAGGVAARLACSWRLSAGCDAVIEASFYGTSGALRLRNVGGSFYDFTVEHCEGTRRRTLAAPPDDWSGRAACTWVRRLATDASFDAEALHLADLACVIDAVYGR